MQLYLGDTVTVQERNKKRLPIGSSDISEMETVSALSAPLQDETQAFPEINNRKYQCSSCTGKSIGLQYGHGHSLVK